MLRLSHRVLNRATTTILRRTIGVASATAIIAGASTAAAFDDQKADDAVLYGLKNEPLIAQPQPRSNPAAYAQIFWPFGQIFPPQAPAGDRRRNSNAPRAGGADNNYIQSQDRYGNPGPTYRVLGVAPSPAKDRHVSHGDQMKLRIAKVLRQAPPAPPTTGPLLLVVSTGKQSVTLFDAGIAVAKSPVSTGTPSRATPTGVFSVIEKQWWHRSNLYSSAPMPFMQRITWSGIALHAGELPGYAASHGCIRLPEKFALQLWGTTKIGARVIVAKNEVVPVEIAHERLFQPKAKPEPAPEPKPGEQTPPAIKPLLEDTPVSTNEAPALTLSARKTDRVLEHAAPDEPSPRSAPFKPVIVTPPAFVGAGPRVIVVADAQAQLAAAHAATDDDAVVYNDEAADSNDAADINDVADNSLDAATWDALRRVVLVDPESTVINGTAEVSIDRPGLPPETLLLSVEKVPTDAGQQQPVAGPVMLASLDASLVPMPNRAMPNSQFAAKQTAPRAKSRRADPSIEMSEVAAKLPRPGPISVLISRRDQRMYVRKGFQPLFDAPITIARQQEPIGTFVFSAVAQNENRAAMRWMVVSLENAPAYEHAIVSETRTMQGKRAPVPERIDPKLLATAAAKAALDRLDLPKEAVERISDLMSVGASLIISDQNLGRRAAAALDSDFTLLTR